MIELKKAASHLIESRLPSPCMSMLFSTLASSSTHLPDLSGSCLKTMAQARFYCADKPLKYSAADFGAGQSFLATPMGHA